MWDDKETISPRVKLLFEKEANFFASCVLFQLDIFDEEVAKLPLSLQSAMFISNKFGASTQATLRRYVEYSKKRCALLVLERPEHIHDITVAIRNFFMSPSFVTEFGTIDWPQKIDNVFPQSSHKAISLSLQPDLL